MFATLVAWILMAMLPRIQELTDESNASCALMSLGANPPLLSAEYMTQQMPICLRLLRQLVVTAFALARLNAGSNMAARMAMIAMTTSSSIRVNALKSKGRETVVRNFW